MADHLITIDRKVTAVILTTEEGVLTDAQKAEFDLLETDEARYEYLIDNDILVQENVEIAEELTVLSMLFGHWSSEGVEV